MDGVDVVDGVDGVAVAAGSAPAGLDAALQEFDVLRQLDPGPNGPAGMLPQPYSVSLKASS